MSVTKPTHTLICGFFIHKQAEKGQTRSFVQLLQVFCAYRHDFGEYKRLQECALLHQLFTHTNTHIRTQVHTQVHTSTQVHTQVHTITQVHTQVHTYTRTHAQTHTHTSTPMHYCADEHVH